MGVLEEHSGFLQVLMIAEELLYSCPLRRELLTFSKRYLIIKILRLGGSIFYCNTDRWCGKKQLEVCAAGLEFDFSWGLIYPCKRRTAVDGD